LLRRVSLVSSARIMAAFNQGLGGLKRWLMRPLREGAPVL